MAAFNFPINPIDQQTYTFNNATYVYSSAEGAWKRSPDPGIIIARINNDVQISNSWWLGV